jgi:predicted alpha/beta superfamily hydrolase
LFAAWKRGAGDFFDLFGQVWGCWRRMAAAIIGESLAGLFVVETFFLEPDLFDTYIALSPSLWWNEEELVRKAGERLKARPDLRKTLYLSSAGDDVGPETERLAEALRAHAPAGLRWQYKPRPDLRHGNVYRSSAPQVLRELFPPVGPS